MMKSIREVMQDYRQAALGTGNIDDPKNANRSQRKLHTCYRVLRETEEGRQSIISLTGDTEPSVRCWAAAHSLQWNPDLARSILEALRDSKGPYSLTAETTLQEYDGGRLTFDY